MNNDITVGLDLGNKKHKVIGLDGRGKVVLKCELSNDKETLGAFFKEHVGATVEFADDGTFVVKYFNDSDAAIKPRVSVFALNKFGALVDRADDVWKIKKLTRLSTFALTAM